MNRNGELILSTMALLALIAGLTLVGIKYVHKDTTPIVKQHTTICDKKPDCKCEVLEAGKVIVK